METDPFQPGKIVLIVGPYDQGDILADFLDWHLDLGVDLILAQDGGSTDGSRDILEEYCRTGKVAWFPRPERDMTKYNATQTLAEIARDQYGADWIVMLDADEFLCTKGRPLREILANAARQNITVLDVFRHNITGPQLQPGQRATQTFNLRVDRPLDISHEQALSGELPAPFLFIHVQGHLISRAQAFESYGTGAHSASVKWGESIEPDDLYILHYAIRTFEELEVKVVNIRKWLEDNPHLPPGWGWHWRRWIRLSDAGLLRQDYAREFPSPERTRELIREGICSVDNSVAGWLARRETRTVDRGGMPGTMRRVAQAIFAPFLQDRRSGRSQ